MDRRSPLLSTGIDWAARERNHVTRAGNTRDDYELAGEAAVAEVMASRARALLAGMTVEEWSDMVDDEIDEFQRAQRSRAKSVACPKCGALPKKPCRTNSGRRAEEMHASRFEHGDADDA